jgi:hypothetical protein
MMKNRYEFTIEELQCYTITLEVEPQDDPNLEEDEAWDIFNALKARWYDHPTCIEHDTHCDIQVSKMEKQHESDT